MGASARGTTLALAENDETTRRSQMPRKRVESLAAAGLLLLAIGGCQRKETTGEATPPAPAPNAAAVTETAAPAGAAAEKVTADPVAASRRNAERRRDYSRRRENTPAAPVAAEPAAAERHEVPAGTILRVAFDKTISTATAKTGDTVRGELLDDVLAADGALVAPSGSKVSGKIEHVIDSGKLARPAELRFRLTELTPKGGDAVPVTTSVYEQRGEAHTKRNVGYIAGGAAVGALLGQILGKDTESTLTGAAAGAAAGTGVAAATGDLDFEIQAGRTVAFTLEEPARLPEARR
jgi:hypothetical protein